MQQLTKKEQKEWEAWQEVCIRIKNNSAPPKKESEKEKEARIKRLLDPKNFEEFCIYYFQDDSAPLAAFGWFHKEAIKDVLIKRERNNIWEWPRECAKSVLADLFITAHLLFTGWLDGLILASETQDKAKKLISDLEAHLRHNQRIIHDFGDFGIVGSWLSGEYTTKDGVGFWAFGMGQNPAGVRNGFKRPNLGIVDDADSKKKAKNQQIIEEMVDWIRGDFFGCLQTKERIFIYANNRVAKKGLTAHMVGDIEEDEPKDPAYKHIKVYWTEDPKTHKRLMPEEGGVPCWRENYTIQHCIDRVKDMGYRNAMRQLYHLHIEDGKVFTDANMPWVKILPLHKYDALVTYCDPAFGESGKGCYRGVVLMGKTGQHYDVIDIWLKQTGNFANAQYDFAQRLEKLQTPVNCKHYVESNELQKPYLKKIYRDENLTRDIAWNPTYDMDKKADKIGRIESMETLADNFHLRFNEAYKKKPDMQTLRDQFKGFPNGFIDGPDCVEGGKSKLNQRARSKNFKTRQGKYIRNRNRIG